MHWPLMTTATTTPLLAAGLDGDTIVGAIVILVSIITWLFKTVAKANQKGPPVANRPRQPVRPRDDKLQREIDIFLQETGSKKEARQPAAPTAAETSRAPAAKVPAAKAPVTRSPARPAETARPARPPRPARSEIRERSGKETAPRQPPGTPALGKGVQSALKQFNQKVTEEVAPQLPHNVDQLVAQHFGQSAPPVGQTETSSKLSHRVVELLRQPDGLRQAMALNLILSPPLASKRRPLR